MAIKSLSHNAENGSKFTSPIAAQPLAIFNIYNTVSTDERVRLSPVAACRKQHSLQRAFSRWRDQGLGRRTFCGDPPHAAGQLQHRCTHYSVEPLSSQSTDSNVPHCDLHRLQERLFTS